MECAVIGAVATRQYMPERATRDLDLIVAAKDLNDVGERLLAAGYKPAGTLAIGGSSWLSPDAHEIDVLAGHEEWWPTAIHDAQANRDAQGLPILSLPYLVLMKLRASRAQDLADISRMLGQAGESQLRETREVVGRYAPKDLPDLQSLVELGRLELSEQ